MKEFIKDKVMIADNEGPISAFINKAEKESWILDSKTGENMVLLHTADPEFSEDEKLVRLVGLPKLNDNEELSGTLIGALVPHLETVVRKNQVITLKNLPYAFMKEIVNNLGTLHYGELRPIVSLAPENAIIARIGANGTNAVLTSDELSHTARGIFVFNTAADAIMALDAFKAYPPFETNSFYTKAEVVLLAEVDMTDLNKEKFLFFDVWQKAIANLSAHMPDKSKAGDEDEK